MLRITKTTSGEKAALKLEGRVAEPWIADLEQVCRTEGLPLVLDFSGVTFADERGTQVIRRLRAEGAELVGLSLFLDALLERSDS